MRQDWSSLAVQSIWWGHCVLEFHLPCTEHYIVTADWVQLSAKHVSSAGAASVTGGQIQRSGTTRANAMEQPSAWHVLQSPAYCSVIWTFASICHLLLEAEQKYLGSLAMQTLRISADLHLTFQAISLAFRCKSILSSKWKQLIQCFLS